MSTKPQGVWRALGFEITKNYTRDCNDCVVGFIIT